MWVYCNYIILSHIGELNIPEMIKITKFVKKLDDFYEIYINTQTSERLKQTINKCFQ